jgi:5-methylcytosine-specific restriction endonuclease McrA
MDDPRGTAKRKGSTRYYGKACIHGHGTLRQTANARCVVCAKQERSEYHATNKSKISSSHRVWRESNKDKISSRMAERYREKGGEIRLKAKMHYEKNSETIKARAAKYRVENREKVSSTIKRHYQANKGKYREYGRSRKARVRGAQGSFKQSDLERIFAKQKGRCAYCRSNLQSGVKHLDHIIPITLGGSNMPSNLQYLCMPCNLKKGSKDPLSFARQLGRLL